MGLSTYIFNFVPFFSLHAFYILSLFLLIFRRKISAVSQFFMLQLEEEEVGFCALNMSGGGRGSIGSPVRSLGMDHLYQVLVSIHRVLVDQLWAEVKVVTMLHLLLELHLKKVQILFMLSHLHCPLNNLNK